MADVPKYHVAPAGFTYPNVVAFDAVGSIYAFICIAYRLAFWTSSKKYTFDAPLFAVTYKLFVII